MELFRVLITLLLVLKIVQVESFIDPASLAVTGMIVAGISYMLKTPETRERTVQYAAKAIDKACQMMGYCEGCEDYWIHSNLQGLEFELKREIFGQSLAVDMILSSLKSHLNNRNPSKPLVLSFQGSPGTGKNYVSQKILENIFKKGGGSRYVKIYRGSNDFPLKAKVDEYKRELVKEIKERVYECHRSVFIFDEVEKMPNGILDVISGFVSAKQERDYDYRKLIFILLSNVGSEALTTEALKAWRAGIPRDEISSKDLTKLIAYEAYNSEGGLQYTRLVKNHDVSHFVPFLPLERCHIVQCLAQVVANKHQIMSPELKELVLDELNFYPVNEEIFSTGGCKGVAEKADYLIEKATRMKRKSDPQLF